MFVLSNTLQAFLIGLVYWALVGKYIPGRRPSYARCVIGAALLIAWSFAVMYLFVGLSFASNQPLIRGNLVFGPILTNPMVALYIIVVWFMGAFYLMHNVFTMPRGHGALLIIYLVLTGVFSVIWNAMMKLFF